MSSILLLIALGLVFSFGLMNVINMAHGELIMVGAYVTFVLQRMCVSVLGDAAAVAASLEGLRSAQGFLQGRVGSELRLKHTPALTFFHDDTAERAQRLERLMDEQA